MTKITKTIAVIASSLIMSVSAFAGELALSGSANASYVVSGGGGANNDDKGLGISNELMFKASGELDNGYSWNYHMELDPNGGGTTDNDDTALTVANSITFEHGVEVSTAAGIFDTTHISIIDENDDIISWELWYNSTVRNYVKIVDRLPGSHSEMVEYELTSFDVPLIPQFITEESNISTNDFTIEWAIFQGAESYQLQVNNQIIYSGNQMSLDLENYPDGDYTFRINAIMPSGHLVEGETLSLNVHFVQPPPTFLSSTQDIDGLQEVQIEWTSVENSAWYSLIVNYSDGTSSEIYNGTQTYTIVEDLEEGQNRLRVKVGLENGIESTYSDSIYLMVQSDSETEPNSDQDDVSSKVIIGFILLIIALFAINRSGE